MFDGFLIGIGFGFGLAISVPICGAGLSIGMWLGWSIAGFLNDTFYP